MKCRHDHEMEFVNHGSRSECHDYETRVWHYERYWCRECGTHYYVTVDIHS